MGAALLLFAEACLHSQRILQVLEYVYISLRLLYDGSVHYVEVKAFEHEFFMLDTQQMQAISFRSINLQAAGRSCHSPLNLVHRKI